MVASLLFLLMHGSFLPPAAELPEPEAGVSFCTTSVCEHQGTCLRSEDAYVCLCPFGYFGATCQHGTSANKGFHVGDARVKKIDARVKTLHWASC